MVLKDLVLVVLVLLLLLLWRVLCFVLLFKSVLRFLLLEVIVVLRAAFRNVGLALVAFIVCGNVVFILVVFVVCEALDIEREFMMPQFLIYFSRGTNYV